MNYFRTLLCIAILAFSMPAIAQETDSTVVATDSVVATTTAAETEEMVGGMTKTQYYNQLEARHTDLNTAEANREAYVESRSEDILSGRIWVIIILVLGGLISGAVGLFVMKGAEAAMKPEIFHLWPNASKGMTSLNITIPEHTFMCQLKVRDAHRNEVLSKNVDNAATKLDLDLSDFAPGNYTMQLVGQDSKSNKVEYVRL